MAVTDSKFLQLVGTTVANRRIAWGSVGAVFSAQNNRQDTVTHGLTDSAGTAITPQSVVAVGGPVLGALIVVCAVDSIGSTTFRLTSVTRDASNLSATITCYWVAIG